MAAWEWLGPWRRKRNQVLTIPSNAEAGEHLFKELA